MNFYVEASIDDIFHLWTILEILDINPDYKYIRFKRHFDNVRLKYEDNIIENISSLNNFLNDIWCNR